LKVSKLEYDLVSINLFILTGFEKLQKYLWLAFPLGVSSSNSKHWVGLELHASDNGLFLSFLLAGFAGGSSMLWFSVLFADDSTLSISVNFSQILSLELEDTASGCVPSLLVFRLTDKSIALYSIAHYKKMNGQKQQISRT